MGYIAMLATVLLGLVVAQAPAPTCRYDGPLPDAQCTPGAVATTDAAVVCARSTRTVRPSVDVTNGIKVERMAVYGVGDQPRRDYELDHLVSLELGGDPASVANLWPQPYAGEWGAHRKDTLENRLHALVCARSLPLAEAQQAIATDWVSAYERYLSN